MNKRAWTDIIIFAVAFGVLIGLVAWDHLHLGATYQPYIGWGTLLLIVSISGVKRFQAQPYRTVFFVAALFLGFRYMDWRITKTLVYSDFYDFLGTSALFLAEFYGFATLFINVLIGYAPKATEIIPIDLNDPNLPTVDILIPTYNEPLEVIHTTMIAALQTRYPVKKKNVYILDDGGTWQKRNNRSTGATAWRRHYALRHLAQTHGAHYITRSTNHHAKSGNINHALKETHGEIILILDCDQAPTSDILLNTVGQFLLNPKLFLVQTPHFFINQGPVVAGVPNTDAVADESELFYRSLLPAMNYWNAAFFCGSAALLRREYLMEIGGIATHTITEDAETSLQLHAKGYESCYIDKPMVCGLSPETNHDYLTQHSRWAKGMIQILLVYNPLFRSGLTIAQRICYFSNSFSWLFGFSRYVFYLAPASFILLGLHVYNASWYEIAIFTIPYAIGSLFILKFFFGMSRQMFLSEIYETVKGFRLIQELLPVFVTPWRQRFMVTPKGNILEADRLSAAALPLLVITAINFLALIVAIARLPFYEADNNSLLLTAVWCVFNLIFGILALGAFWDKAQFRRFHRTNDGRPVSIFDASGNPLFDSHVDNLSATGIAILLPESTADEVPETLQLRMADGYGTPYRFRVKVVRTFPTGKETVLGCEFIQQEMIDPTIISFIYGDSTRWKAIWEQRSQSLTDFRLLASLGKLGFRAFWESLVFMPRTLIKMLFKYLHKCFTTPHLLQVTFNVITWLGYIVYAIVLNKPGANREMMARSYKRYELKQVIQIYFPRYDTTLPAETTDISLSGLGVYADISFNLTDNNEHIIVSIRDKNGEQLNLNAFLDVNGFIRKYGTPVSGITRHGIKFIIDYPTFKELARLVYGSDIRHYLKLALVNLGNIIKYLFLRPDRMKHKTKARKPQ